MKKLILYSILLSVSLNQTVISGFITNKNTGEVLIGANIFIPKIETGIISDKNGFYSILIEEDLSDLTVVVQYLGYNTINEKINEKKLTKSTRLDFELTPTNIELKSTENASTLIAGLFSTLRISSILSMDSPKYALSKSSLDSRYNMGFSVLKELT